MNVMKRMYCRIYQGVFRILLPILPYREPKILEKNIEIAEILKKENIFKVLLVTDVQIYQLGLTQKLEETLQKEKIECFVYNKTVANPTSDNVMEAVNMYRNNQCEGIIAFGGGSAMDCAKATGAKIVRPKKTLYEMKGLLKVRKKLPVLIAVPTTAGTGSETTLAAVITDSKTRLKYAINDFSLIPEYAMLDAELTIGLPPRVTAMTGMDAFTHAAEAFIGRSTTKQTRKEAKEAVRLIVENLEVAYQNGTNFKARKNMLTASYKAGIAFTQSYVGYVHAVAHSLGGKYNIAHGLANAIVLPIVLKRYGKVIYKKLWELGVYAGIFDKNTDIKTGAERFISKIEEMNQSMGIEKKIPQIQIEDIPMLAKTAYKEADPLYPVPVLWTEKELEQIYYMVKE